MINLKSQHNEKLPGLNGMRAIAASLVLFIHVFQIAGDYGDKNASRFFEQHHMVGTDMVNLFFVISGFIITYILLKERRETGTISLKNFYIRRILRIWPLYFGILLIVLVLMKFTDLYSHYPISRTNKLLIAFFIAPLVSFLGKGYFGVLPHYWSLSVEEQFYIFWPPLFKKLTMRQMFITVIMIIAGMVLLRNSMAFLYSRTSNPFYANAGAVLNYSLFGSISIGITGAFLVAYRHSVLSFFFKPVVRGFAWTIFILSILVSFYIPYIHFETMGFVYLVLILNVTLNPSASSWLNKPFMNATGKISYGIYMYHWPLIPLIVLAIQKLGWWDFFVRMKQLPLVFLSFSLTYLVSYISYTYIESYILKFKPSRKVVTPNYLKA